MSILLNKETKVIVQAITGREGGFHARLMKEYGTQVVGGVTPGKGRQTVLDDVPVFNTVKQAVEETGATASCIFVRAEHNAADAVMEAADAQVPLIVCITEGIPQQDMVKAVDFVKQQGVRLIGGNCPGLITPGDAKIGIMPGHIHTPGPVGIVSRSGTLTYEVVVNLSRVGIGQTTVVGIGGDPILGTRFVDVLPLFEADPETKAVVLCGEIGGSDEEVAAEYIKSMTKPVVSFISGRTAPEGKRMGHAGAIISGRSGTPQAKVDALNAAGATVADSLADIPDMVQKLLS
ncbi:MAG: succinate--CoA ligase subunit alpha [Armatimonadetes bacterium]|nr:succinate--CoA ligase subunit alpha [Armatimonadota bacterium]